MSFNPAGKCAVVTGGSTGIGLALCQELAAQGARKVIIVDLDQSKAHAATQTLPSGVGFAIIANCGVEMDIRKVIIQARSMCGDEIDAFFTNAGIPSNGGPEVTDDEWHRIMQVNVMQTVYVARHLFPFWERAGRGGHLCVTASAAGLLTQIGALPYSVTKHAAVAAAEWLRITYAPQNIVVSCLCPQAVQTAMVPEGLGSNVAGLDGVLSPQAVAKETLRAMAEGRFLVLPHQSVDKYFKLKAGDYERWLQGMGKLQQNFGAIRYTPNLSAAKL